MEMVLRFFRKVRVMLLGERFSNDLADEMAFHREHVEKELKDEGIDPEEAHYAAQRRFGNELQLREQTHDLAGFSFAGILHDFRFAVRQLRKNPGFAATAILILALGVGATTAIFSVVDPILFQPLPYTHPDRIAMIWETAGGGAPLAVSLGTFVGIRER